MAQVTISRLGTSRIGGRHSLPSNPLNPYSIKNNQTHRTISDTTCGIPDMAQSINIDPLEIIASLEIGRARECDKKRITDAYWAATVKTVGSRLDEAGHGGGYRHRR